MTAVPTIQLGTKTLGAGQRTFLIAEAGSNHNVDLSIARRLIEATADAGWDAIKFQSFRAEWLYPPNCGMIETPMGNVDFFDVLERNQLPTAWLQELKAHAETHGLLFICTPFDEEMVAELEALGVAAIKIASPELNHLPLIRCAARTGRPLICSSGLCTLADIEEALSTIDESGSRTPRMLLHCVSAYPTPEDQCNLLAVDTLRRAFGVPVGYSDHTTDYQIVPAAAVSLGACAIEKHITIDRTLPGPDHPFAIEPDEMKAMATLVRELDAVLPKERLACAKKRFGNERIGAVLGHGRKEIMPVERPLYPNDKRSIHALRDINAGEALSEKNIRILRSERNLSAGLHPRYWSTILNVTTTRQIGAGQGIEWCHLLRK